MKELLDINAVECFSVGKAIIWGINKESFTYPHIKYLLETFTKTPLDIIKSEVASMLAARIRYMDPYTDMKAIPTIMEAYIFGSFAKGISRSDSDIDILLIVESVCNKEELAKALQESVGESLSKKIGNFISFHIYSKSEVDKNNPHWLKAAIESGIKVYE
jgi:predicted nucleotidyltransferase